MTPELHKFRAFEERIQFYYIICFPVYYKSLHFHPATFPSLDPVRYISQDYIPQGANTSKTSKTWKATNSYWQHVPKITLLHMEKVQTLIWFTFFPATVHWQMLLFWNSILRAFLVRIHQKNHLWYFMYWINYMHSNIIIVI